MEDCSKCTRTDIKCCFTCKKDAEKCKVYHHCGSDCPKHEYRKITNADLIRSMSDEELAEFLDNLTDNCCRCAEHQNCGNCQIGLDAKTGFCDIKKWLQSEAE